MSMITTFQTIERLRAAAVELRQNVREGHKEDVAMLKSDMKVILNAITAIEDHAKLAFTHQIEKTNAWRDDTIAELDLIIIGCTEAIGDSFDLPPPQSAAEAPPIVNEVPASPRHVKYGSATIYQE
jgi:hypothetical protein